VTTSQAVELVSGALADVLEMDPHVLRPDTPLDDVGADSMVRVGFADAVESRAFHELGAKIEISDDVLSSARTLGDLADHVSVLIGSTTESESI